MTGMAGGVRLVTALPSSNEPSDLGSPTQQTLSAFQPFRICLPNKVGQTRAAGTSKEREDFGIGEAITASSEPAPKATSKEREDY